MPIPVENVGSLPRPIKLQEAIALYDAGKITFAELQKEQGTSSHLPLPLVLCSHTYVVIDAACLDSIKNMEATGQPYVTDGEQRASSFATYPLADTLAGL
jgi:hypothetical protein